VTINGLNIKKDTRRIRNIIGCVFQDTIVDESFTGYENLQLHGALCGIKKDELKQRIAWVSDVLEIKDFLSNKVKFYSGGVKRKLDIAVALINDPQILYMDEPTVGLDPNIRRKLWEHIKHIQKERNMSVIITTHYLDEADYLCGRISIIDRGEIVVTGIPADLKREVEGDSVEVVFQIEDMEIVNQKKESIIKCFEDKMNINGVKFTNNSILVYCNNFGNDIVKISEIISLFDLKPNSFINSSPSLDDVFIKYAGRHLK
jgi:ABC-2 type transport system ATP-binding protein